MKKKTKSNSNLTQVKEETKYLDKDEFYNVMKEFNEKVELSKLNNTNLPPIPEKLGKFLLIMAEKIVNMPRLRGYSYKDEMIGDCLENALRYGIYNFKHLEYDNPHAYFTQIMYWACKRRIYAEEKQLYIKYKNMEMHNYLDEIGIEEYNSQSDTDNYDLVFDKTQVFIEKYESALTFKKNRNIVNEPNKQED